MIAVVAAAVSATAVNMAKENIFSASNRLSKNKIKLHPQQTHSKTNNKPISSLSGHSKQRGESRVVFFGAEEKEEMTNSSMSQPHSRSYVATHISETTSNATRDKVSFPHPSIG